MFSVVIPTYNRYQLLDRCLNSLNNQKFKDFEILLVDNYSVDKTETLIQKYNKLDIKYKKLKNYDIVAESRNLGIKLAKYKYIAFLDSDDWWTDEKLLVNYSLIKKYDYNFLYHDLNLVNSKKKNILDKKLKGRKIFKPYYLDLLINGNPIMNSSVVVSRHLLNQVNLISNNSELVASEDFHTWIKIFLNNPKAFYIKKTLGYYEYHDGGMSRKNMYRCSSVCAYEFTKNLDLNKKKKILARLVYVKISYLIFNKKTVRMKYLLFCLRNSIFSMKLKILVKFIMNFNKFIF